MNGVTHLFAYHGLNSNQTRKEKTTYGSQRPVVMFTLACGQYEPSGQATAINKKLNTHWKILMDHEHNYLITVGKTHAACK